MNVELFYTQAFLKSRNYLSSLKHNNRSVHRRPWVDVARW